MYLTAALWLPDQSGILMVGSGRDSNFNRSQIGIISYPQGIYRPITNDTNSYPSISLSADGKTIATIQSQYVGTLETATVRWQDGREAGYDQQPSADELVRLDAGRQIAGRAGKWHFSNERRRQQIARRCCTTMCLRSARFPAITVATPSSRPRLALAAIR